MKIALSTTYASNFLLNAKPLSDQLGTENDENAATSDLSYTVEFEKSNPEAFKVVFTLLIDTPEYNISAIFVAAFQVDEKVTNDFMLSPFVSANAPAIAFPFLRSYINTVTVNSGFRATLLSAINFMVFKDYKILQDGEIVLPTISPEQS